MPKLPIRTVLARVSDEKIAKLNVARVRDGLKAWPTHDEARGIIDRFDEWLSFDQRPSQEDRELEELWAYCRRGRRRDPYAKPLLDEPEKHPRYQEVMLSVVQDKKRPACLGGPEVAPPLDPVLREQMLLLAGHPDDGIVLNVANSVSLQWARAHAQGAAMDPERWRAWRRDARNQWRGEQNNGTRVIGDEQIEEMRLVLMELLGRVTERSLEGGMEYTLLLDRVLGSFRLQRIGWDGDTIDLGGTSFTLKLDRTAAMAADHIVQINHASNRYETLEVRRKLAGLAQEHGIDALRRMLRAKSIDPLLFDARLGRLDSEEVEELWQWSLASILSGNNLDLVHAFMIDRATRGEVLPLSFARQVAGMLRWKIYPTVLKGLRLIPVPGDYSQVDPVIREAYDGIVQLTKDIAKAERPSDQLRVLAGASGARFVELFLACLAVASGEWMVNQLFEAIRLDQWKSLNRAQWAKILSTAEPVLRSRLVGMMARCLGGDGVDVQREREDARMA